MNVIGSNSAQIFLLSLCFFIAGLTNGNSNSVGQNQADLIIYSYDRPMQLFALLESIDKYVSGLSEIFVIMRTSSNDFERAYKIVEKTFKNVHFIRQTPPYEDLQELTLGCVYQNPSDYVLFGVDDIIVKDAIDLNQCCYAINEAGAHGFFLRLGKNLDYCYAMSKSQKLPPLRNISEGIYSWHFDEGEYDWQYPNNLDFTLYRKSDLVEPLCNSAYKTPNSLESQFMGYANMHKLGLCYKTSKIINFPLNIVQTELQNPCGNTYSTKKLLNLFNQGLKIDISKLHQIQNKSAHSPDDYLITFIPRNDLHDEKLMIIVTPSYNNKDWWEWNLTSLINQNYSNYRIIITDDCSTDGTGKAIEEYIEKHQLHHKVTLIKNKERRGALHNLYTMIHSCPNEAICVTVDGDDALADPEVLARLNEIYSNPEIWLTYGQYQEYPNGTKGFCSPMPEHIIQNNAFRNHPDLPSHLRTFYAWLFKAIKLEDLLYNGEFYRMTWDCVMMLPMIEMAGERHLCIENQIMYIYNNANAISDHKISRQLQAHLAQVIRAKPPYQRLSQSLEKLCHDYTKEYADFIIFAENTSPELVDCFLTSLYEKVTGLGKMYVLYRYDQSTNKKYTELKKKHKAITFLEIDQNGDTFKDILSGIYHHLLRNNYLIFSWADNKIDAPINLHECIQTLEETQAYGFSLKLSKVNPRVPITERLAVLDIKDDVCAWNYAHGNDVWSCANSIDLTLYRRPLDSISRILHHCWMYCPIHLQGWWAHEGNLNKVGLCFKYPKVSKC